MSQSQTLSQLTDMNDSQNVDASPDFGGGGQLTQSSTDQEQIRKSVTCVSDNASDVRRALRDLGGFTKRTN